MMQCPHRADKSTVEPIETARRKEQFTSAVNIDRWFCTAGIVDMPVHMFIDPFIEFGDMASFKISPTSNARKERCCAYVVVRCCAISMEKTDPQTQSR
jgi:hypothetical protein